MSHYSLMPKDSEVAFLSGSLGCVLLLFTLPIIVLDLWFAQGPSECLTQETSVSGVTLALWLRVDAITGLIVCGFLIMGSVCSCILGEGCGCVIASVGLALLVLSSVFGMSWVIIGAMIFWGDLYPGRTCESSLSVYMFIRLIYGFASYAKVCFCGGSSDLLHRPPADVTTTSSHS